MNRMVKNSIWLRAHLHMSLHLHLKACEHTEFNFNFPMVQPLHEFQGPHNFMVMALWPECSVGLRFKNLYYFFANLGLCVRWQMLDPSLMWLFPSHFAGHAWGGGLLQGEHTDPRGNLWISRLQDIRGKECSVCVGPIPWEKLVGSVFGNPRESPHCDHTREWFRAWWGRLY